MLPMKAKVFSSFAALVVLAGVRPAFRQTYLLYPTSLQWLWPQPDCLEQFEAAYL